MKRFLILFMLCITTTFNAWGINDIKLNANTKPKFEDFDKGDITDSEKTKDPLPPNDTDKPVTVTYSFSSGNNGACYVNKATPATKPSTYWFCGKESAKCNGNAWSSQDTVKKLTSDKNNDTFEHAGKTYYCCYDEKKSDTGTFKIYQGPIVSQEKYELSGTNGGWCYHTISTDVCDKKTITKPCKTLTNCPSGKQIHNNKCLSCPSGQHFKSDTSDDCEPDKLNCSGTQEEHNGQCVDKCTGGKHFESATSNRCVCDSGMVEIKGVCETKKTCASDENYIELTNTCLTKLDGASELPDLNIPNPKEKPAEITYEFLFNDTKSCYVKKPSDNSDKKLYWCGKPDSSKCGDYKQSEIEDWVVLREKTDVVSTVDNYCCCDGTESKAGEFRKCTTPGTRTKIKKVGGGLCEYTVGVDICNRETVTKDCNTPDAALSVAGKTPVTKSNMQECGLCTTKDDFKKCVINSCYEIDASGSLCTNKLKKACSIKK